LKAESEAIERGYWPKFNVMLSKRGMIFPQKRPDGSFSIEFCRPTGVKDGQNRPTWDALPGREQGIVYCGDEI
jgi:hypothetical protein